LWGIATTAALLQPTLQLPVRHMFIVIRIFPGSRFFFFLRRSVLPNPAKEATGISCMNCEAAEFFFPVSAKLKK
jgi:hypothetical protein